MGFRFLRRPIVAAVATAAVLFSAAYGSYTARLWFKNVTTGQEGTGAILCKPGDQVSMSFSFHGDANRPNSWTILQMLADLSATSLMADADANNWDLGLLNKTVAFGKSAIYGVVVTAEPDDGPIYDLCTNPGDSTQPLVTSKGLTALIGVAGTANEATNVDKPGFFTWTIPAGAKNGDQLVWMFRGRVTDSGVATKMYDSDNASHDIADNWLVVDSRTPTTTGLVASPNPSTAGQSVTLTATITPTPDGGTVQFFDGATSLGTSSVAAGVATLSHTFTTVGAHALSATFSGTTNFSPSTGNTSLQVNGATTTTTLTSDTNPSKTGQAVNLTATVSPVPDGGTVQFKDGGVNIGSAVSVNTGTGKAVLNWTFNTTGVHHLSAVYSGDANFATSTGTLDQTVNKNDTTTTVNDVANPSNVGDTVTITATVTPIPDSGTVQFTVDSVNIGSPVNVDANGKASTTNKFTVAGNHTVGAAYGGSSNFDASSGSTTQVVNPAPTTTTLVAAPNPADRNANVTLTATVAPVPDGGTVQFKDGATVLGTSNVDGTGKAALTQAFSTGGPHSLTCHYSGTTNYQASDGSTTLSINKTPTSTGLVAAPNPSTAGQQVTLTATVTPVPDGGTVQFMDGATSLGTSNVDGTGTATLNHTFTAVGAHSLSAVYSGTTNFATSTGNTSLQVNPASTTTTLTSDVNPSLAGQQVNLTATVTPVPDGGTVQFMDGASNLGAAVAVNTSTGKAVLPWTFNVSGVHHLSAVYSGDANFATSTGTLDQTVNKNTTTTTVADTPNPSNVGDTVTITATVSPVPDGGTVQFTIDGNNLGGPVNVDTTTGKATTTNKFSAAKSYAIGAAFSGSNSFSGSSGSTTQVVNAAPTTTTLVAAPNPADRNANVTLTATVAPVPDGGTVQFKDGATVLGTSNVDGTGKATLTQAFSTAGPHSLTCHYSGTSNFQASDGSTTLNVNKTTTTTSLAANPNPVDRNASTTLTATVTPIPDGGTVTFMDGATTLGTGNVDSNGHATLSQSFATAGPHTLAANYGGTTNFASSSGSTTLNVNKTPTSTAVTADTNPSKVGQLVNFTATVTPVPDGGTVQFKENGVNFGSPVSVDTTTGKATIPKTFTTDGARTIEADYSGDTNFASSSGTMTQTVNKTATSTALTTNPNPSNVGQQVTLTATVTPVPDGGTVTFMDGATNLGTASVDGSGNATKTVTFTTAGSHSLTANYSGTAAFASSSGSATQTVNQTPTTTTLVAAPNPSTAGQQVTLTATVTPVPDGGTVTFMDGATTLGTSNVDGTGKATLTHTFTDAGPHSLTANYSGTANYQASSGSTTLTVNKTPTTTTLVAVPNPAQLNQNVTLTATVTPVPDGGSVTFMDGANTLGTANVDGTGKATLTQAFTTLGNHNLEADYSGTAKFDVSKGTTTLVVNKIATMTALTANPNPTKVGDPTVLTATVTPVPDGGTVNFLDGGNPLGTATVDTGTGKATLTVTFADSGVHSLEADFSGTATFDASSGTMKLTVKTAQLGSEALQNLIVSTSGEPFGAPPLKLFRPEVINIDTVTVRQVLEVNGVTIDSNLIVQAVRVLKHTPYLKCTAFVTGPGSGLNTNFDTGLVHSSDADLDKSIEAVAFGGAGKFLLGDRSLLFSPPGTTYQVLVTYVVRNPVTGRTGPPQTKELHWTVVINTRDDIRNNIEYFSTIAAGATQKPKIDELPVAQLNAALDIPDDLAALIQFETVVATYDTDFSVLRDATDARFIHGYLIDDDEEPIGCLLFEQINSLLWH